MAIMINKFILKEKYQISVLLSVSTERTRIDTLDDRQKSSSLIILIVSYRVVSHCQLLVCLVSCGYILDFASFILIMPCAKDG